MNTRSGSGRKWQWSATKAVFGGNLFSLSKQPLDGPHREWGREVAPKKLGKEALQKRWIFRDSHGGRWRNCVVLMCCASIKKIKITSINTVKRVHEIFTCCFFFPRWKGENVSTMEVSTIINTADFVQDANVYGVEIPGIVCHCLFLEWKGIIESRHKFIYRLCKILCYQMLRKPFYNFKCCRRLPSSSSMLFLPREIVILFLFFLSSVVIKVEQNIKVPELWHHVHMKVFMQLEWRMNFIL